MQYVHVKNLEKYHPGYQDRTLIWSRTYFTMLNADPEFELLCETDKWRFIAMTMLELQLKKPIPLDPAYLKRKGFDIRKRPIHLTLKMLHTLVEVRDEGGSVTQRIVEKSRVEKSRVDRGLTGQLIMASWNKMSKTAPVISPVKSLSPERRSKINARLCDATFVKHWEETITSIPTFPFLIGRGKNKWTVSFDWFIANDTNWLKVHEGRYRDDEVTEDDVLLKKLR